MQVPDSMAGASERCPRCGRPITVPDVSGEFGHKDEAYIEAITAPRNYPEAGLTLPREVHPTRHCPKCGRLMSTELQSCPFCGEESDAAAPTRKHEAEPAFARFAPATGAFRGSCLRAGRYAVKSFPALLLLTFMGGLFYAVLRTAWTLATLHNGGDARLAALSAVGAGIVAVYALGYFGRFCLGVVESTLRGASEPAKLPSLNPVPAAVAAVRVCGLLAVYVLPVVTLPLLPIGLIAQACGRGRRGYDLPWAVRAAGRCADDLGLFWLILLPCAVLSAVVGVVVMGSFHAIAAGRADGLAGPWEHVATVLLLTAGAMLTSAVLVPILVGACRCVGMLGRHNPQLLNSLRRRRRPLVGGLCLAGGLTLAAAVVLAVVLHFAATGT